MARSAIRRVVGVPELLSFGGDWLTKRGKRFTGLAAAIAAGVITIDILGGNTIFGHQIPIKKLEMATVPVMAAGVTFGLGGAMNYTAKLLSGSDRAAAEANSIREVREIKQTDEATKEQAKILWDRVGKYESALVNGNTASEKERETILGCRAELFSRLDSMPDKYLSRLGIGTENRKKGIDGLVHAIEKANPLSSGIESSEEGFIESVVFALEQALPHMEQKAKIGFDLSQVESYRNWEIFESNLANEYGSNRFLRSARKRANIPFLLKTESMVRSLRDNFLNNLTRNKMYMLAGKGMNSLNSQMKTNSFDAQPFIWMTPDLKRQMGNYGNDVLEMVVDSRANMMRRVFENDATARRHVYDCFDADYLRALGLRLGFDVEYAAGLLDQKPREDIGEISELIGQKILSEKALSKYEFTANESLNESHRLTKGLDSVSARAVRINHYTREKSPSKGNYVVDAEQCSDELVQTRIHDYLAREQITFHCGLVERLGDSKV